MAPPPPRTARPAAAGTPSSGVAGKPGRAGPDKREAILAAALELFVERGFHGTAVPDIADRAGVGAGTIYRHFASKEALGNALFQHYKGEMARRVMASFQAAAPAREQFRTFWNRLVDFARDEPLAFAFLELHHHASYLDDASRRCEHGIMELGVRFIEQAQARGELKPLPPMLLAGIVLGACTGLLRMSWEGKLELTPKLLAASEQCAWEAVRA